MIQLANHFRDKERSRHSELLNQHKWFIKAKQNQERREEIAEQSEDSFIALASDVIIANEIQIREFEARMDTFEVKLDNYDAKLTILDEAVARALMEQISRLDMLETEKQTMLDAAFTLDDGRKVFRSKDGTFAVDESGITLTQLEFDSRDIPAGPNSAEDYLSKLDNIIATKAEVDKLHTAQQEIDAAREQSAGARDVLERGRKLASKEDVSVGEIYDLEMELGDALPKGLPKLPSSALKYVSGVEELAPSLTPSFQAPANAVQNNLPSANQTTSAAMPELGQ